MISGVSSASCHEMEASRLFGFPYQSRAFDLTQLHRLFLREENMIDLSELPKFVFGISKITIPQYSLSTILDS